MSSSRLYGASDLYGCEELLTDAERGKLAALRTVLDEEVRPVLADHWERAETPVHVRASLAALRLVDDPALLDASGELRELYLGFRTFEFARTDIATGMFYGGQVGMFRTVVSQGGSPEQAAAWEQDILDFRRTGCFALTEPEHGSDVAGGLATTARRVPGDGPDGDHWVLDGAKRWIGNAAYSDYAVIVARDVTPGAEALDSATGEPVRGLPIKAFIARTDDPGMTLSKIERKISLRTVHNADITLDGVVVPESHRLQRIQSFADIGRIMRTLRPDAAWIAAGLQAGAYEAALRYTTSRQQFGRPIAGFQMIQDKLVRMLGNVTASLAMLVRLSERRQSGLREEEDAALAKLWVADRMRETVALARDVCGGNGIVIDHDVARYFVDAESVYTYEGTHEVNTLIVGRHITGLSAFVR